jgi:hypothetical protein
MADSPPPVLDSARVLAYACVDANVRYIERHTLYLGRKLVGQVPRLAICQNLNEEEILVFHCDSDWNVLGVAGGNHSIAEAKSQASRSYIGIDEKWVETGVSVSEAEAYLREAYADSICSFCGKLPHEFTRLIEGKNGRICNICVSKSAAHLAKDQE